MYVFRNYRTERIEKALIAAGLTFNITAIVVRAITGGYIPIKINYESTLFMAALIAGGYLVIRKKVSFGMHLGLVALPVAVLFLFGGYASSPDMDPLTPDYFSRWMYLHVAFTIVATVCLVFATGTSVVYLLRTGRYGQAMGPGGGGENQESSDRSRQGKELGDFGFRLVLYGFICWTVMLITGSLWAKDFWGSYWSWDPVETWSLICWLAWGLYIHLFLTYGWRGKKLAWLCILIFLTCCISIWGIKLVSPDSYHNLQQLRTPLNNGS